MSTTDKRRLPAWLFPASLPLLILGGYALLSWWQVWASGKAAGPTPVQDGPFRLSAVFLPPDCSSPLAVQSTATGQLGLLCTSIDSNNGSSGKLLALQLPPGHSAGEPPAVYPRSQSDKPALLTEDGRALKVGQVSTSTKLAAADGMADLLVQLQALPSGNSLPASVDFHLRIPQYRGRLLYALLEDGTLAAVGRRPDSYGMVRLQLCGPEDKAQQVQELGNVVMTLPACTAQGQTLAVLAKPGRLYILDRQTRRLELRPELEKLAQAIFAGGQQLYAVALGEGFAVAAYAGSSTLKLYASDGSSRTMTQIDPERSRPDGSKRKVPLEVMTFAAQGGKWQRYARQLAAEGRSAPANVTTESPQLAVVAADCIAIVDRHYNRVVLVEYGAAASL